MKIKELIKRFRIWNYGLCDRCEQEPKTNYSFYCGGCINLILKEKAKRLTIKKYKEFVGTKIDKRLALGEPKVLKIALLELKKDLGIEK